MYGIATMNELLAEKIGVNQAIMLSNIQQLMLEASALNAERIDGSIWIKKTVVEFQDRYKYFTTRQIRTILENLEKVGYIESKIFNEDKFDKTKSYTITKDGMIALSTIKGGI